MFAQNIETHYKRHQVRLNSLRKSMRYVVSQDRVEPRQTQLMAAFATSKSFPMNELKWLIQQTGIVYYILY